MWSEVCGPLGGSGGGTEITGADVQAAIEAVVATNILGGAMHEAAVTDIKASSGAFVAIGAGAAVPTGTKRIRVHSTIAIPLDIRKGANAGAAAAASVLFYLGRGESAFDAVYEFTAADKIWVRSVNAEVAASGELSVTFLG